MGLQFQTPKSAKNLLSGNLDNQSDIKLAPLNKTYTENGTFNLTIPEGFDGIDESVIKIQVPSEVNNQTKERVFTANGNYVIEPDATFSGLDKAKVTVSVLPKLQEKASHKLVETLLPDVGFDGLSKVVVSVPVESVSKTYSANGTYVIEPSEGKEALSKVTVKVDCEEAPELEELDVTENGVYEPAAGKDGFSKVTVNVEGAGELEEITATENFTTYRPSAGKVGFSKVYVDVPSDYYVVSKALITDINGESILLPPNVPGYSKCYFDKVIVRANVRPHNEPTKLITANGTYTPAAGYDGFNKIVVDVDDSQYSTYIESKKYTKPGDYTIEANQSEGSAISQVDIDIDIPTVKITEVSENGVRGASYQVPMNKIMGGEFTDSTGKRFYIEW